MPITSQQRLANLSAGDSELLVLDVSRPDRPRLAAQYVEPKTGQAVWDCAEKDGTVFLNYFRILGTPFKGTWSGIRAVSR